MRQINLSNYSVRLKNEQGEYVEMPYEMKESLIEVLLARDNQLSGRDLLDRDIIARKIDDCRDGQFLLEEEEWNTLCMSVNTVKGLGRPDVEFTRRILEAQKVEVEEKK